MADHADGGAESPAVVAARARADAGNQAQRSPGGFWAPGPARWRKVLAVAAYGALMAASVAYTNHVDHRTREALCAFLTANLPPAGEAPAPATERARVIEQNYRRLVRDLRC
jgi:hypothetical protein